MSLIDQKQFIFIIGAPRSGTTWLQALVANHTDVASLGSIELRHFSQYIAPVVRAWDTEEQPLKEGKWEQGYPMIMPKEEFDTFLKDWTANIYAKILAKNPTASHILDKHPAYSFHIDIIKKIIPNAKFIHLIRDGREVVVSAKSASRRNGFGYNNTFNAMAHWQESILAARRAAQYGDDYLELRYEDLKKGNKEFLTQIFDFCKLKTDETFFKKIYAEGGVFYKAVSSPTPKSNAKSSKWEANFSVKERFIIEENFGTMLRQLGYTKADDWWAMGAADKLKITAFRLLRSLRNLLKT